MEIAQKFWNLVPGMWRERPSIYFYYVTLSKVNKLGFVTFKFYWCAQFSFILEEKAIVYHV